MPSSGGGGQHVNADTLNQCLNEINANQLSVSEVEARARQCLRGQ
jgi:hypothetical protein